MTTRIERMRGSFHPLIFNITLRTGKTEADVDDVAFSVKNNPTATSPVMLRKMSDGNDAIQMSTPDQGQPSKIQVRVKWEANEYNAFDYDTEYTAGCVVKYVGDPGFDESVTAASRFKLKIKPDMVP